MLFNSAPFIFAFLPVVVAGFAVLTRLGARRATLGFLVLASLSFYGWWNWRYLSLILFSIAFNYSWGSLLQRRIDACQGTGTREPRRVLAAGIAVNLALLGYFKYRNFVLSSLAATLGWHWQLASLELPLAISFFTFEQIIFLVTVYRDEARDRDFLSYCFFITFFPHLIAGPIIRYKDIIPQLTRGSTFAFSKQNLASGLFTFAIGLFKKVVIADTFRPWVAPIFDQATAVSFFDAWGGTLAFGLYAYFDVSGYADMAIGLALMFNIRFPENFDSPYQAQSIIDFWRRWHMTLSNFLRDYLYIPLGGNRSGAVRRVANLMITMLLGGLWHGANWTFVIWGGLHGLYITINHLWRRVGVQLPGPASWALTFAAVLVGYVFVRAESFDRARVVLAGMAGVHGFAWDSMPYSIGLPKLEFLLPALAVVLWCPNRQAILHWQWRNDHLYALAFALLAGLSFFRLANPAPFYYFQF